MHASNAFLNGAAGTQNDSLALLRALRAGAEGGTTDPAKRRDERQAEEERQAPTANEKGGEFNNDPDDAANPNEVRERHNSKVKPS